MLLYIYKQLCNVKPWAKCYSHLFFVNYRSHDKDVLGKIDIFYHAIYKLVKNLENLPSVANISKTLHLICRIILKIV